MLAHAYFPGTRRQGQAHFDDEETWAVDEGAGRTQLLNTLTHEFGHRYSRLYPVNQPTNETTERYTNQPNNYCL